MNTYPLGNNILIRWRLRYSDDSIFPLSLYDYELGYRSNRGAKMIADSSVAVLDGDSLTWTFRAEEQITGTYTLYLKIILSGSRIIELQYDNAFALSPLAEYVNGGQEVNITSICDGIDLKSAVLQARKAMDIALESKVKASDVQFERALEHGIDIGTITINGISKKIYSPDYVEWGKILNRPELYTKSKIDELLSSITTLIPNTATSDNMLADKAWVNSRISYSIASNTATFKGTYGSVEDLPKEGNVTNDYAYVTITDASGTTTYNRYKYTGTEWAFEYAVSNITFDSEQWAAINSGITKELVAKIGSGVSSNSYIGTTKTQPEPQPQALTGILSLALSADKSGTLEYDLVKEAWHLSDNFIVDGILAAGAAGYSGGGSGFIQLEWIDIQKLTESKDSYLASAYAVKEAYNDLLAQQANIPAWALKTEPELYIGKTKVQQSSAIQELRGISAYHLDGTTGTLTHVDNYWNLSDNFVVSGFLAAGSSKSGGGAGYTQAEWSYIQKMQSSEDGCLASAYAIKEAYDAILKTHVGKTKGTLIIGGKSFNGETDVTITTMDLGIPTWAMDEHLAFSSLPELYIGKTKVQQAAKAQSLTGIQSILLENALGALLYDNNAWSLDDNLIVSGFLASGSSMSGGGAGYTQADLEDIKKMTKREEGVVADAYAMHEMYDEVKSYALSTAQIEGIINLIL